MMYQIYRNATSVLVWLGDRDSDVYQGFDILEKIHKDAYPEAESQMTLKGQPDPEVTTCNPNVCRTVGNLTVDDYIHLKRAFNDNSYWSRAWVIQEVVHARKLEFICGTRGISWDIIFAVIKQLSMGGNATSPLGVTISPIVLIYMYKCFYLDLKLAAPLLTILQNFKTKYCSEPRDNIYAFLNLSTNGGCHIRPDYTKTVSSVFLESTTALIQESRNLSVICNSGPEFCPVSRLSQNPDEIIPSWVPDWSSHSSFEPIIEIYEGKSRFKASSTVTISPHTFTPSKPWQMKLRGVIFDTIAQVFPRILTASMDWKTCLLTWLPEALGRSEYPTREEISDVVWKVLLKDTQRSRIGYRRDLRIHKDDEANYRERFSAWREHAIDPVHPREEELGIYFRSNYLNSDVLDAQEFARVLAASVNGYALFTTQKGYIGLTAGSAEVGDRISVVHGAPVPLILRYIGKRFRGKYVSMAGWSALVGSAYVHGIMDGEVMETLQKGEVKEKDIFLI